MRLRGRRFEVDRTEGKFLGVCAGLANHSGIDATIIRVGLVLVTLMGAFPWTVIAYFIAAFVGQPRRTESALDSLGTGRRDEARERMRDFDLRMKAIETYASSSNSRLAREIEELR